MVYRFVRLLISGLALVIGFAVSRRALRTTQSIKHDYGDRSNNEEIEKLAADDKSTSEAPSRIIRLIKRYALAELATLVGLPLALIALIFTALATRDTARQLEASNKQLELSRAQAQPIFRLSGYAGGYRVVDPSTKVIPGYNRLVLTVNGSARNISARASSTLIWPVKGQSQPSWNIAPIRTWQRDHTSENEYLATWEAREARLEKMRGTDPRADPTLIRLVQLNTLVVVDYEDVLGMRQNQYFRVSEWPYLEVPPQIEQGSSSVPDVSLTLCADGFQWGRNSKSALNERSTELLTIAKVEASSFTVPKDDRDACLFVYNIFNGA